MARRLTVIDGNDEGLTFELGDAPATIGTSDDRSLTLDDDRVSRRHFSLLERDGETLVRDENSTNGTFLNGEPIRGEAPVHTGDCIMAGGTVLMFENDAEAPPEAVTFERGDTVDGGPGADASAPTRALDDDAGGLSIDLPTDDTADHAVDRTIVFGKEAPPPADPSAAARHTRITPPSGGRKTRVLHQPPTDDRPDLMPIIREVIASAGPLIERTGIRIGVQAPPVAPSSAEANTVYPLLAQSLYACLDPAAPYSVRAFRIVVAETPEGIEIAFEGDPAEGLRNRLAEALGASPLRGMVAALASCGGRVEMWDPQAQGARIAEFVLP